MIFQERFHNVSQIHPSSEIRESEDKLSNHSGDPKDHNGSTQLRASRKNAVGPDIHSRATSKDTLRIRSRSMASSVKLEHTRSLQSRNECES